MKGKLPYALASDTEAIWDGKEDMPGFDSGQVIFPFGFSALS